MLKRLKKCQSVRSSQFSCLDRLLRYVPLERVGGGGYWKPPLKGSSPLKRLETIITMASFETRSSMWMMDEPQ